MVNYHLKEESALKGARKTYPHITLREVTNLAITSLAVPKDSEKTFAKLLKPLGFAPEGMNGYQQNDAGEILIPLAQDQYFLLGVEEAVTSQFRDTAFLTDQSDGWTVIRMEGAGGQDALARICLLDLAAAKIGYCARTMMEHMNVILLKEADDRYLLLSPRSSAASFYHALKVSAENTISMSG